MAIAGRIWGFVVQIGWVDYSDSARQITLQILDALKEHQAIDELGIGIVRDAFADKLFPATSTLLTRAKYFFLVPYALRDLERAHDLEKTARQLQREYDDTEKKLAIKLLKSSEVKEGIFGGRTLRADFSGTWVKRGPGVIYWASLRTLGFLKDARMGYSQYFGAVRQMPCGVSQAVRVGKGEDDTGLADDVEAKASYWSIPNSEYRDWKRNLSIDLTQEEAVFFRERIIENRPETLYSLIADNSEIRAIAYDAAEQYAAGESGIIVNPYHLFVEKAYSELPPAIAELCKLGVDFSNFVYGCRIRYNSQIPSQAETANELWADYAPRMRAYAESLDIDRIYEVLGMAGHVGSGLLYKFLKEARDCMRNLDVDGLDEVVRLREIRLKRGRAKIGRELSSNNETWAGGALLSYRYDVGMRMIQEIQSVGGFDA